ncbi:hypothetical protein GCM10009733_017310 [Nonomuraea maheshkhaliensis]|uniref:Uncharacterized protein n=1 Tax=Nonomuraea maheshkhaliensis TaxID=419590 RepID=A0ABN2EXJ5_9ACTN
MTCCAQDEVAVGTAPPDRIEPGEKVSRRAESCDLSISMGTEGEVAHRRLRKFRENT